MKHVAWKSACRLSRTFSVCNRMRVLIDIAYNILMTSNESLQNYVGEACLIKKFDYLMGLNAVIMHFLVVSRLARGPHFSVAR